MIWPKISIETPSFNQGQYIEQTILSVLSQNYPNLEYIIIDGGSTDNTVEIIKKYESWLTYWVSEPDRGQSHAINKGLDKCTGEIFNWLNSDDWYTPGALFEVANAFMNNSSAQFVSGHENHVELSGHENVHNGTFLKLSIEETIEFCELTQPSTFFKLNAIRSVNGVSEDLHYIMDGEMWVKLLLLYGQDNFIKIDKVLVNFRLHANSKTVSNSVVDNFLFERSSIVSDLQRFIKVPKEIVSFYISEIYKTPTVYHLGRNWKINESIISPRKLRIWFIQKYVNEQFRRKDYSKAYYGVEQLMLNKSMGLSQLKNILKLTKRFFI
jgi:glycosyltransferase involved in cell wall biosynthesis